MNDFKQLIKTSKSQALGQGTESKNYYKEGTIRMSIWADRPKLITSENSPTIKTLLNRRALRSPFKNFF